MTLWAHTLVKNEERYLWFAITSVINYVDKVLLWDTGSTDNTVLIIKELTKRYPGKIEFNEVGNVDINEFTSIRSEMLRITKSDWFILLDGDEVWWDESIKKVIEIIMSHRDLETIVNHYVNVIGDIYHYQDESVGKYKIDNKIGNLTIRAVNRSISGINIAKPHGQQGFYDGDGRLIQERDKNRRKHIEKPAYLHFTHMIRSGAVEKEADVPKRKLKYKFELGKEFPLDFYYPEAFFIYKPDIVPNPWFVRSDDYLLKGAFATPLRYLKRRFIKSNSGY